MKTSLRSVSILLFVLVTAALGAKAKKPGQEPANPVEQAAVDRIMAADAQANPQFVRNKFCPITGKPVDPAIAPVDCPQKFQHIHKLVGVGSKEASDAIAAAVAVNKSNKWLIPDAVVSAASNNMLVDLSNPKNHSSSRWCLHPSVGSEILQPARQPSQNGLARIGRTQRRIGPGGHLGDPGQQVRGGYWGKGTGYDESCGVPMIVAAPAKSEPIGEVTAALAILVVDQAIALYEGGVLALGRAITTPSKTWMSEALPVARPTSWVSAPLRPRRASARWRSPRWMMHVPWATRHTS